MPVSYEEAIRSCDSRKAFLPVINDDNSRDKAFRFGVFNAVPNWQFWVHLSSITTSGQSSGPSIAMESTGNDSNSVEEPYETEPTIPSIEDFAMFNYRKRRKLTHCVYFK